MLSELTGDKEGRAGGTRARCVSGGSRRIMFDKDTEGALGTPSFDSACKGEPPELISGREWRVAEAADDHVH